MTEDFSTVTRVDQFIDVNHVSVDDEQVLDKALKKIVHNISTNTIRSCYPGISSDDALFLEIAANKMLDEYKEEAKVRIEFILEEQETIIRQCEERGIFEFLNQLDTKDTYLEEKKEIAEKQFVLILFVNGSCGSVIDVNKLLSTQRMHIKKQVIQSLEKQILSVHFTLFIHKQDEAELHDLYLQNKVEMKNIQKGIQYLKTIPQ